MLTTVSCKLLDTIRCNLSGLPSGAGRGPHPVAPPARLIGQVSCLCACCMQCLALFWDTERLWRPSLDRAVFHVPSSKYLASSVHALTFLARVWVPSRRLRRRCFHHRCHLSWTLFLQCRIPGCARGGVYDGQLGSEVAGKE